MTWKDLEGPDVASCLAHRMRMIGEALIQEAYLSAYSVATDTEIGWKVVCILFAET